MVGDEGKGDEEEEGEEEEEDDGGGGGGGKLVGCCCWGFVNAIPEKIVLVALQRHFCK